MTSMPSPRHRCRMYGHSSFGRPRMAAKIYPRSRPARPRRRVSVRSTRREPSENRGFRGKYLESGKQMGLNGGAEEDRTPDLRIANATLSQLSYGPTIILDPFRPSSPPGHPTPVSSEVAGWGRGPKPSVRKRGGISSRRGSMSSVRLRRPAGGPMSVPGGHSGLLAE
jgi:hypothetical protein